LTVVFNTVIRLQIKKRLFYIILVNEKTSINIKGGFGMSKYVCTICGFVYDESAGIPDAGIAPGTKWEELPENWTCPFCGASKADFKEQHSAVPPAPEHTPSAEIADEEIRELSFGELSALCSNLAKGCEKQYLPEEAGLFSKLADYYKSKTAFTDENNPEALMAKIQEDLSTAYPQSSAVAAAETDRGALRALTWSEKVTRMLNSLLSRYEKEGGAFLERTNVFVCEICGFVYVGDEAPDICPVCKVPKMKIAKLQRR